MLLDLTDPANEAHDDVQYPASYVRSIVETCLVNYGGDDQKADGIDQLIRCFEKQLDTSISSKFWPRTTLWLKNLYDQ